MPAIHINSPSGWPAQIRSSPAQIRSSLAQIRSSPAQIRRYTLQQQQRLRLDGHL
jgi:hypothetical protein